MRVTKRVTTKVAVRDMQGIRLFGLFGFKAFALGLGVQGLGCLCVGASGFRV